MSKELSDGTVARSAGQLSTRGHGPRGGMTEGISQFQIGPQLKNQGLVIVGAAGGAADSKRPGQYDKPRWDVTIKMDRGPPRVVSQSYEPLLREGDRVRVLGTQLELVSP